MGFSPMCMKPGDASRSLKRHTDEPVEIYELIGHPDLCVDGEDEPDHHHDERIDDHGKNDAHIGAFSERARQPTQNND